MTTKAKELALAAGNVDSSGNINADTVDSLDSTQFLRSDIGNASIDLAPIESTIADTAVDVFVYDTRKDSDGGAWRKRTQHTSWYNETLNTATRGSRKEFPSVAVIVAESNQVTIYDGDDPALPMWMVFNCTGWNLGIPIAFGGSQSLFAVNGMLVVGDKSATSGGITRIRFIEDYGQLLSGSGWAYTFEKILISGRNTQTSSVYAPYPADPQSLVSYKINDVAMTVLPNAPIDAATGLPVPTIAVATDGGVSVIKDDGTVVDKTSTSSPVYNKVWDIAFTDKNDITFYFDRGYNKRNMLAVWNIPTSDYGSYDFNGGSIWTSSPPTYPSGIGGSGNSTSPDFNSIVTAKNKIAAGKNIGLTVFDVQDEEDQSAVSYITSDYNTGWMNGDIKLATLSDTDATSVTGAELVTNGTFDTDSDWIKGTGWTISGGKATHSQSSGGGELYQEFQIIAGNTYVMSFTIDTTGDTSIGNTSIGFRTPEGSYLASIASSSGSGSIAANMAGQKFAITLYTSSTRTIRARIFCDDDVSVDDWSVRLAEEDRSVNNKGLQVFGTVTKTPVATGADLVAYSGFSSTNYLKAPAIPAFNTSDYFVSTWVYFDGTDDNYHHVVSIENQNSSTGVTLKKTRGGVGDAVYFYGNNTTLVSTGVDVPVNTWIHLSGGRKNGVWYIYVNGKLTATGATNTFGIGGTTTTKVTVGFNESVSASEAYALNKQALVRISATFPSDEQIKKIYEDEKVLFQEGAQATLYGTSNAVTALAYDDTINLLHVGTSAGRSDFSGLRRVSNTTDAVGTAISASNGMIVEE